MKEGMKVRNNMVTCSEESFSGSFRTDTTDTVVCQFLNSFPKRYHREQLVKSRQGEFVEIFPSGGSSPEEQHRFLQ